ncbi:hypothetical protein MXB_1730, partial [Myxobolus squamalis]
MTDLIKIHQEKVVKIVTLEYCCYRYLQAFLLKNDNICIFWLKIISTTIKLLNYSDNKSTYEHILPGIFPTSLIIIVSICSRIKELFIQNIQ